MKLAERAPLINTDIFLEANDSGDNLAVMQYESKLYNFWSDDALKRTFTRYASSTTGHRMHVGYDVDVPLSTPSDQANSKEDVVLDLPAVFQSRTVGEKSVNTLQEWECVVKHVGDEHVFAVATSVLFADEGESYLDIPLDEFDPEDRSRLRNGLVFRLIVGFVRKRNGIRTREALIYIRHQLPRKHRNIDSLLDELVDG
jgi:hypothetical protein